MNEIRNIGIPHARVLPAGRKERATHRASEPAQSVASTPPTVMDRRRNPDRRRSGRNKAVVERRTSSDRRTPRIDIDV